LAFTVLVIGLGNRTETGFAMNESVILVETNFLAMLRFGEDGNDVAEE